MDDIQEAVITSFRLGASERDIAFHFKLPLADVQHIIDDYTLVQDYTHSPEKVSAVAEKYGISVAELYRRLDRLKVERRIPRQNYDQIAALYEAGETIQNIMLRCQCCRATVYRALRHREVSLRRK